MSGENFITSFCTVNSMNSSIFDQFAFKLFTPCFEEVAILGTMNTVAAIFCIIRLVQLSRYSKQKFRIVPFHWDYLKLVVNAISLLLPIFQLNARLGQSIGGHGVHGRNTANQLAPFEMVSFTLTIIVWSLSFTVVLFEQFKYTIQPGSWIMRFVWLFSWSCQTIKFYFNIVLTLKDSQWNYFFYLYLVQYSCIVILGLLSIYHFPILSPFVSSTLLGTEEDQLFNKELHKTYSSTQQDHSVTDIPIDECPEATAGWFSTICFNWISPLMKLGFKKPLEYNDVWQLNSHDRAAVVYERFQKYWKAECKKSKPSLWKCLIKAFGPAYAFGGMLKLFNDASQFTGPIFLNLLIKFVSSEGRPAYEGYLYAIGMFIGSMVGAFGEGQYFHISMRVGMQVRSALMDATFQKSMVLSAYARQERSTGKLNNIISQDCESIQNALSNLHVLWSSPLRIVVALVLLYQQLGMAMIAGALVLLLATPIQGRLISIQESLTRSSLKEGDDRVQVSSEAISSMNVIKLYAWERSFLASITALRDGELKWLYKIALIRAFVVFFVNCVPVAVSVVAFAVFSMIPGNVLTPAIAFTSISLFSVLRMPLMTIPNVLNQLARMEVAIDRILDFLLCETVELPERSSSVQGSGSTAIEISDGSFTWNANLLVPTLQHINLNIKEGSLVTVVGQTGEGKSSLLHSILGDMVMLTHVPVKVSGTVAFVPQQSWIFNATIKENILFGKEYDEERYLEAIYASCLDTDLEMMESGDQTEIGEKGANLSGGQKQRVSIARAVYANADVYLFDDPLSALDAHVAKEVNARCICGVLANKTRIFATNRTEFVAGSDYVIMMHRGRIQAQNQFQRLLETNKEFAHLIAESGCEDLDELAKCKQQKDITVNKQRIKNLRNTVKGKGRVQHAQLIMRETIERGALTRETIDVYIRALGGNFYLFMILSLFAFSEVCRIGSSFWMSLWCVDTLHLPVLVYILVYGASSSLQSTSVLMNQLVMFVRGVEAGAILHRDFFKSLFRARMSFFNATPIGRILNRITKDIGDIDRNMVFPISTFLGGVVQLLGTLIVIGTTTYYALASFVPILCVFYWVQRYFQACSRELKRLDAVTRSPIYNHFSQCLNGISTIRAYRVHHQMSEQNRMKIDDHMRMIHANNAANRWLSIRLEVLGGLMILVAAVVAIAMRRVLGPQSAGLSLSYALQITGLLNVVVRLSSAAENSFNAIERMQEYIVIESEAAEEQDPGAPEEWPKEGVIEFDNVRATYRNDLPPVLNGLTFHVAAKEKVGIVGRTGAGKSSLLLALFRLIEATCGVIKIDGIDISTIGLRDLRKKLSIIPQDPVLFSGTVRSNLDPLNEHVEDELWEALHKAHLKIHINQNPAGLDTRITENGEQFSLGQRQLICLARALLRKSKILVLDEATAAVDIETDSLIQKTIREEFSECTTLTIAHRLNTIIDSDKVLVMDKGRAAEFDKPSILLGQKSIFAGMVNDTGAKNAKFLRKVALKQLDYTESLADAAEIAKEKIMFPGQAFSLLRRNQTISAFCDVRFENQYFEDIRRSLMTLRNAIRDLDGNEMEARLEQASLDQREWINELQNIIHLLGNAADKKCQEITLRGRQVTTNDISSYLH